MSTAVRALPDGFKIRTDLYQVIPPLGADDMAKLRDSIAKEGVQIPVIVREEDGGIIDGHHRWQIATELSMTGDVVLDIRSYATDALARAAAYEINDARRHMGIVERRELARKLRASGATQKETADALGVSQPTIAGDLAPEREELSAVDNSSFSPESIADRTERKSRKTTSAVELAAFTEAVGKARDSGLTYRELAEKFGVSNRTIAERLRAYRDDGKAEPAKWERARDLAADNVTSDQIAVELAVSVQTVRKWARRHGFEIAADSAVANTRRRINSGEVLANSVEIFAHTCDGLELIKFEQVEASPELAEEWLCSLKETQSAIRTLIRQIKSLTKEQSHG